MAETGTPGPLPRVPQFARRLRQSPLRVVAAVAAVGLLLTVLSTYATAKVDYNTEQRLLQTQTKQAAAVLTAAVQLVERPLTSALDIQRTLDGDAAAFAKSMRPYVGPDKQFASASVWRRSGNGFRLIGSIGAAPAMKPRSAAMKTFLRQALSVPTYAVQVIRVGDRTSVVFAEAGKAREFMIYAERAVPPDGRTPSDRDSAFSGLHYAAYIGRTTDSAALATTDLPLSKLPITGDRYRTEVPFGDSQLTLVATPRGHLGGGLSEHLPLILLIGGALLTALACRLVFQVVRSRQSAESDAATISSLYQRVDAMYGEQRDVSVRLQRALLPPTNPEIPGIEVASEYVAGAQGVDIGGDWYSIVRLDDEQFAFVVGDVSGHGIDAVAVMARARFTLRAYLLDGNSPDAALAKCSQQFDISADGHMATVLVGVGNRSTGEITLANAGHPPPVLVSAAGAAELVRVPTGPPLGTGLGTYPTATLTLEPGETLVAYTDGLVERRGEDIEVSLDRLARTVELQSLDSLVEFVASLLDAMHDEGVDDIAVLALKRLTRELPSAP